MSINNTPCNTLDKLILDKRGYGHSIPVRFEYHDTPTSLLLSTFVL